MKMRKTRTTIAVIGEGPTEKYYLKSLEGVIHAQVKPVVPNHATSMAELERRIEQCIDDGYNMIFCLIDMDNKKEGRNRENYLRLKTNIIKNDHQEAARNRKSNTFLRTSAVWKYGSCIISNTQHNNLIALMN